MLRLGYNFVSVTDTAESGENCQGPVSDSLEDRNDYHEHQSREFVPAELA